MPFSFKETDADGLTAYVADPERAARVAGIGGRARPAAAHAARRAPDRGHARRPTRPSTPGSATPSAWTPRRPSSGCCAAMQGQGYDLGPFDGPGRAARRRRPGRRRADPRADRRRRAGRGLADRRAAGRQPGADPGRRRTARWLRHAARPSCATRGASTGARRPARCSSTARTRRRHRVRRAAGRQRRGAGPAAARLRGEPDRDLPRPGPAALAPLPGRLPVAASRSSARTPSSTSASTATWSGCRARTSACRRPAARTPRSATCRWSTRSWSTTRARAPRPSAGRTPRSSTTWCRRWPAPSPTATSPGWSSCSTSTRTSRRWTRPSCPPSARRSGRCIQAAKLDHDLGLAERPDDDEFDEFVLHVDGWLCEIKDVPDPRRAARARRPAGRARTGSTWCWRCCGPGRSGAARWRCPGCARRSG